MWRLNGFRNDGGLLVFDARPRWIRNSIVRSHKPSRVTLQREGLVLETPEGGTELYRWTQHFGLPRSAGNGYWSITQQTTGFVRRLVSLESSRGDRIISSLEFYAASAVVFHALAEYLAATPEAQAKLGDPMAVARLLPSLKPQKLHTWGMVKALEVGGLGRIRMNSGRFEQGLRHHYPRLFAGHFVDGEEVPTADEMVEALSGWVGSASDETVSRVADGIVNTHRWGFSTALGVKYERLDV